MLQLRRAESSGSWDLEWKRWILGLSMPLPPLLGDRSPCSSPHLPSPPLEAQPELLPACVPQSAGHPCPQLPLLADHLQAQPWPAGAWQGPQQARDGGANGWRSPPLLPGIGGPRGPGGDSGPGHTASGSQGPRAMEVALTLSTPVTQIRARSRGRGCPERCAWGQDTGLAPGVQGPRSGPPVRPPGMFHFFRRWVKASGLVRVWGQVLCRAATVSQYLRVLLRRGHPALWHPQNLEVEAEGGRGGPGAREITYPHTRPRPGVTHS